MKTHLLLLLLSCLVFIQCKKESPFVPKDVIDKIEAKKNPVVGNIAFIFDNDVFYLKTVLYSPKRLTNTPSLAKKDVRISHQGDKIAYLNSNGSPIIIDTAGKILNTLTQFVGVKSMDWSTDDKTLYMLTDDKIKFFGPALSLPTITYAGVPVNITPNLEFVTLSSNNDIAYCYSTFDPFNRTVYKVIFKKNGSNEEKILANTNNNKVKHLLFVPKTNELMIGYSNDSDERLISKIEFFLYLEDYSSGSWESSERYIDPIYRSDLQYLVCGYRDSNSNTFVVSAVRQRYPKEGDYHFDNYSSSNTSKIYVNWK